MKKKGFTLIELLAVIIILGILMLIAIPSVTTYINNSRKSTYVDTIQQLIKGAVAKANSGDLEMFDTDTTYYVPVSAIQMENGKLKSPFGDLEDAYVVVTYDGESYDYYFVGKDTGNMGIGEITKMEVINKDMIEEVGEIPTNVGIEGKSKIVVFGEDLVPGAPTTATTHVSGNGHVGSGGNAGENNGGVEPGQCIPSVLPKSTTYGMTVYYDPVSSNTCNASNAGSGTCYTWHVIGSSGNNVNIMLDHSVGETEWISSEDYGSSDVETDLGPKTVLNYLKNATSGWTRVNMLNYEYTMSTPNSYDYGWDYYYGYDSLYCTNGTCENYNGDELVTDLRARLITSEEVATIVNDAILYHSETPSTSQMWTSAGGLRYTFRDEDEPDYNDLDVCGVDSFYIDTQMRMGSYFDYARDCEYNKDLSWLNDDDGWTLSAATNTTNYNHHYLHEYAYSFSRYSLGPSTITENNVGVFPVITVPKSSVVYA